MERNEFVIFAELKRDFFEKIVERLKEHFPDIEYGSQGDDWIWVYLSGEKIEIDSFTSMNLEIKGRRGESAAVNEILQMLEGEWTIRVYTPPKVDLSR